MPISKGNRNSNKATTQKNILVGLTQLFSKKSDNKVRTKTSLKQGQNDVYIPPIVRDRRGAVVSGQPKEVYLKAKELEIKPVTIENDTPSPPVPPDPFIFESAEPPSWTDIPPGPDIDLVLTFNNPIDASSVIFSNPVTPASDVTGDEVLSNSSLIVLLLIPPELTVNIVDNQMIIHCPNPLGPNEPIYFWLDFEAFGGVPNIKDIYGQELEWTSLQWFMLDDS